MLFERLKEERERLKLTQPQFAEAAGAKKRTLIDWEKGVSSPTAVQLSALDKIGVDVLYVVTGVRSNVSSTRHLTPDEQQLLDLFRAAPLAVKAAAMGALEAGSTQPKAKAPRYTVQQTIQGNVGQQAAGDIVNKGRK